MNKSRINILICEDEHDIRKLLKIHIENEGFNVFEGENGLEALDIISKNEIHMLLVDIMMPFKNGFEVVRELRIAKNYIPIIILTARTENDNKVLGLDLGADDYICKPFDYREVISRINSQLRRYLNFSSSEQTLIKNGNLSMNKEDFTIFNGNNQLDLNPMEFKLLEIFMSSPGRVFTKEQLYERAWESPYLNDDNTLMVHISRLREKLQCKDDSFNYIETIRGLGYRMIKIEKN